MLSEKENEAIKQFDETYKKQGKDLGNFFADGFRRELHYSAILCKVANESLITLLGSDDSWYHQFPFPKVAEKGLSSKGSGMNKKGIADIVLVRKGRVLAVVEVKLGKNADDIQYQASGYGRQILARRYYL